MSVKFVSFRIFVFQMHYQHLIKIYIFFVSAPYAHALKGVVVVDQQMFDGLCK